MIYIFQGCGNICKAPCICCKGIANAFDSVCKGCGDTCHAWAQALSDCWAPIVQNPLGFFVIGTWLTMALCVAACVATIMDAGKAKCRELVYFCVIDIGIAFVHMAFAFYIQRCLVKALTQSGRDTMTHQEITHEAKNLLKYDIGFCLYFFFFFAAFCYNFYAVGLGGQCSTNGYQMGAIGLHLTYGVGAFWYALCWYCGQCCFGKAEKRGVIKKKGGGELTGTPVGAPA